MRPPEPEAPSKTAIDADAAEAAANAKSVDKSLGLGKVAGVVQPLHQIVSRTKFVEGDQDNGDDGEEWTGIGEEADETLEAPEVIENDLGDVEEDDEDVQEVRDGSDDDGEDDEELAWEDLVGGDTSVASAASSKRPREEEEDEEEALDPRRSNKGKEPRMKTNKRKAESFYTHANVKNKNRNKKRPENPNEGRKKRK